MMIRPILTGIHGAGSAHHRYQHQEHGAQAIQTQMQRFAAQQESALPLPILATKQHPQCCDQSDYRAGHGQSKPGSRQSETSGDTCCQSHESEQ